MEFFSFLQLYIRESDINPGTPFLLLIAPLLFNIAEYSMEFYRLVRKKTAAETLAVMQLPLGFAVWGGVFLSVYTGIPTGPGLAPFRIALSKLETALGLLALCLICLLLMAQAKCLWNKQKLSYVTGCLLTPLVALPCLYRLITGHVQVFYELPNLVLICYLYAVLFLVCKILLLILGTLICVCTARMRKPVWHPRKNPILFFWRYFTFRQNAVLRGTLLFWPPLILLYALVWGTDRVNYMDSTERGDFLSCAVITALMGVAAILLSLLPACLAVKRLGGQGNLRVRAETFCREYFQEQSQNDSHDTYTATLHFLIDEETPAAVYPWSELCACSDGWVSGKEGWFSILRFRDGRICAIPREDSQAKNLMELARRHLGKDLYPERPEKKTYGWASGGMGIIKPGFIMPWNTAPPGLEFLSLRRVGIILGGCMIILAACFAMVLFF